MRRISIVALALATLAAGCENGENVRELNERCKAYGGVQSTDWHGDVYVCKDGVARDL